MFSEVCNNPDDSFNASDEWINKNVHMLIKDNTPMINTSKYS